MSYDKSKPGKPLAPLDPALFEPHEMRAALAAQDIGTVYRRLTEGGISQHQLARRTGQSQSEVCEILKGREVIAYKVLARVCDGLGVPRWLMGLSHYGPNGSFHGQGGAYAEGVTIAEPPKGVTAEMRRRALILSGAVAAFGHPVLGELVTLPGPSAVNLPNQLDWHHVEKVRDTTRRLGLAGHGQPSDPDVCSAAAARANRFLDVPGAETIRRALLTAAAELHLEAGWAAFDAGLYDRAMHHNGQALEIATEAGDPYCQAVALSQAGLATIEHGHPERCGPATWCTPRSTPRCRASWWS